MPSRRTISKSTACTSVEASTETTGTQPASHGCSTVTMRLEPANAPMETGVGIARCSCGPGLHTGIQPWKYGSHWPSMLTKAESASDEAADRLMPSPKCAVKLRPDSFSLHVSRCHMVSYVRLRPSGAVSRSIATKNGDTPRTDLKKMSLRVWTVMSRFPRPNCAV